MAVGRPTPLFASENRRRQSAEGFASVNVEAKLGEKIRRKKEIATKKYSENRNSAKIIYDNKFTRQTK